MTGELARHRVQGHATAPDVTGELAGHRAHAQRAAPAATGRGTGTEQRTGTGRRAVPPAACMVNTIAYGVGT